MDYAIYFTVLRTYIMTFEEGISNFNLIHNQCLWRTRKNIVHNEPQNRDDVTWTVGKVYIISYKLKWFVKF